MIRVLHILHRLRRAGSQTLLLNINRAIDRSRYQFDYAIREYQPGDYSEEFLDLGSHIYMFSHVKERGICNVENELIGIIKNHGPYHAFHTHPLTHSGYMLRAAFKAGVSNRIVHSHLELRNERIINRIFNWYMRLLIMKYSTTRIAVSKDSAEWLYGKNYLKDPLIKYFPNAIDLNPYSRLDKGKTYYKKMCSLPEDKLIIGHIGRFAEQKNHRFLLKIFIELLNHVHEAHLVLIGDGELQTEIINWAHMNNLEKNISFLGVRKDIPELLGAMDLFLFPSLFEGLGIVLVEAQAAGLPCVVSSIIPREADMGLGLLDYVDLNSGVDNWLKTIRKGLRKSIPSWEYRQNEIRRCGFDVQSAVKAWEQLYSNGDEIE